MCSLHYHCSSGILPLAKSIGEWSTKTSPPRRTNSNARQKLGLANIDALLSPGVPAAGMGRMTVKVVSETLCHTARAALDRAGAGGPSRSSAKVGRRADDDRQTGGCRSADGRMTIGRRADDDWQMTEQTEHHSQVRFPPIEHSVRLCEGVATKYSRVTERGQPPYESSGLYCGAHRHYTRCNITLRRQLEPTFGRRLATSRNFTGIFTNFSWQ